MNNVEGGGHDLPVGQGNLPALGAHFNGNGLPLPDRYEMRDHTPAPLPDRPQAPRSPHKKLRPEPVKVKSKVARLAKLWIEAEEMERKLRALGLTT